MTTLSKTYHPSRTADKVHSLKWKYGSFMKKLESGHFALVSLAIAVSSCLGGISIMKIFQNDAPLWQLVVCVGLTTGNLVVCTSQNSTRWVATLFALNVLANTVLILINSF